MILQDDMPAVLSRAAPDDRIEDDTDQSRVPSTSGVADNGGGGTGGRLQSSVTRKNRIHIQGISGVSGLFRVTEGYSRVQV